ncbi:MAG: hypothetical protein M2R45_04545 [Verrucomicrobia subdivision 3 bacterium]|nr:hypothetical protein [Limisphaerales bacterium]MCS1416816.1 hypothetical protein [Limisphaerales bacterium]
MSSPCVAYTKGKLCLHMMISIRLCRFVYSEIVCFGLRGLGVCRAWNRLGGGFWGLVSGLLRWGLSELVVRVFEIWASGWPRGLSVCLVGLRCSWGAKGLLVFPALGKTSAMAAPCRILGHCGGRHPGAVVWPSQWRNKRSLSLGPILRAGGSNIGGSRFCEIEPQAPRDADGSAVFQEPLRRFARKKDRQVP